MIYGAINCPDHFLLLGTFSVTGIGSYATKTTGLYCTFSSGSQAIGCLARLTEVNSGASFCIVIPRYKNSPVNASICPAPSNCSNVGQNLYSVQVYDIDGDGQVSSIPAVANMQVSLGTVHGKSCFPHKYNNTIHILCIFSARFLQL